MGHSTTAMLFKVYSRFVPNLTRMDGQAFAGLLHSQMAGEGTSAVKHEGHAQDMKPSAAPELPDDALTALQALSPYQLSALMALVGRVPQ